MFVKILMLQMCLHDLDKRNPSIQLDYYSNTPIQTAIKAPGKYHKSKVSSSRSEN